MKNEKQLSINDRIVISAKQARLLLDVKYDALYSYVEKGYFTKIKSKSGRYYFYQDEIENFFIITSVDTKNNQNSK